MHSSGELSADMISLNAGVVASHTVGSKNPSVEWLMNNTCSCLHIKSPQAIAGHTRITFIHRTNHFPIPSTTDAAAELAACTDELHTAQSRLQLQNDLECLR